MILLFICVRRFLLKNIFNYVAYSSFCGFRTENNPFKIPFIEFKNYV